MEPTSRGFLDNLRVSGFAKYDAAPGEIDLADYGRCRRVAARRVGYQVEKPCGRNRTTEEFSTIIPFPRSNSASDGDYSLTDPQVLHDPVARCFWAAPNHLAEVATCNTLLAFRCGRASSAPHSYLGCIRPNLRCL